MPDGGTSVTLIFYHIGNPLREAGLNLIAAAAQGSSFCHVEISLGESIAAGGAMNNVLRVFNDAIGVELTSRTGRSPSYSYLQIGCSHQQLNRMMTFARGAVGKPFSSWAMARSLFLPRRTDGTSYFCAGARKYLPLRRLHILTLPIVLIWGLELVAACLQAGGLLSASSNAGAATPASLHKLYSKKATSTGNPFAIRQLTASIPQTMHASYSTTLRSAHPLRQSTTRNQSPPRTPLRVVSVAAPQGQLQLSLTSLGGSRR